MLHFSKGLDVYLCVRFVQRSAYPRYKKMDDRSLLLINGAFDTIFATTLVIVI